MVSRSQHLWSDIVIHGDFINAFHIPSFAKLRIASTLPDSLYPSYHIVSQNNPTQGCTATHTSMKDIVLTITSMQRAATAPNESDSWRASRRRDTLGRQHCSLSIYIIPPCGSPSPPLFSGSSLISVSILIIAIQASTALFNCRTLLMLGSMTPIFTISTTFPRLRSSP